MNPMQELAEVSQRPVRECSKAFQNYTASLLQPMQELAAAFGFPPRRSSPSGSVPGTRTRTLEELRGLPPEQQLGRAWAVYGALSPSARERFLRDIQRQDAHPTPGQKGHAEPEETRLTPIEKEREEIVRQAIAAKRAGIAFKDFCAQRGDNPTPRTLRRWMLDLKKKGVQGLTWR